MTVKGSSLAKQWKLLVRPGGESYEGSSNLDKRRLEFSRIEKGKIGWKMRPRFMHFIASLHFIALASGLPWREGYTWVLKGFKRSLIGGHALHFCAGKTLISVAI